MIEFPPQLMHLCAKIKTLYFTRGTWHIDFVYDYITIEITEFSELILDFRFRVDFTIET